MQQHDRVPQAPPASKVNWHRVFAVSSLVFALLLISGSIYLHVQQKHHLGRLRHEHHPVTSFGVDATPLAQDCDDYIGDSLFMAVLSNNKDCGNFAPGANNSPTATPATASNSALASASASASSSSSSSALASVESALSAESVSNELGTRHVTEACLQCICEATSGCKPTTCGPNADCGVFRISQPYWLDAGKPQLQGNASKNSSDMGYSHCVNNVHCAGRTVAAYVSKYGRDCNQDGVVECRDHIALHLLGPRGCVQTELLPVFEMRIESCLSKFE